MMTPQARFPLGQTMATPAVLKALEQCGDAPAPYLDRHICGDWGDVELDDRLANEDAVLSGGRNMPTTFKDLSGKRFGKWLVTDQHEWRKYATYWLCECKCGTRKYVQAHSLSGGRSKGCRKCFNRKGYPKSRNKEHSCWYKMAYRFGFDGDAVGEDKVEVPITVCERWRSFPLFMEDMGPRPSMEHVLHREDQSLGFFPGNCKWEHRDKVAYTTSRTQVLTYKGKTLNLSQWAKELGLSRQVVSLRLKTSNDPEKVLRVKGKGGRPRKIPQQVSKEEP